MVEALYTTDFERLWKAYPRKTGKGKAFQSFQKLRCEDGDAELIISTVEKYKLTDQWKKDGGQFIPHLSTFLNQRRFEDEVEVGGQHGKLNKAEQQYVDNRRAKEQALQAAVRRAAGTT